MSDLKDIMGVPSRPTAALPFEADAPAKTKAPKMKRPEGLSREAFALHDGSHPIAPTHLPEGLKKTSDIQGLKQKRLQTSKGRVCYHAASGRHSSSGHQSFTRNHGRRSPGSGRSSSTKLAQTACSWSTG